MLEYVRHFLDALAFSVVLESLVILGLCLAFKYEKRIFWVAVLGTLCTIPYVWFVFPTLFWFSSTLIVYLGEGFAVVVESILYKTLGKLDWEKAILFSLVANSASYFLGKVI